MPDGGGDGPAAMAGELAAAARAAGLPLRVLAIGDRMPGRPELVLVRPDNYVAWTGGSRPQDATEIIDKVRGASA
jgi:hypothetical protein